MSSDTADKKNEELEKDVLVSSKDIEQEKPSDAQAKGSCSVPSEEPKFVPTVNENPLAKTRTVSDVNSVKLQSMPQQDLLPSLSLDTGAVTGSAEPGVQQPANIEANSDTKDGTAVVTDHIVSVNPEPPAASKLEAPTSCTREVPADSMVVPPSDSKVEALKSSMQEALADSRVEISSMYKAEPPADSKTELPADSKVKPSSEVQPTPPKPNSASSDIDIKNLNVRELKNEVKKIEFAAPATNDKSNTGQPTPPKPNAASSDIEIKNVNVRELKNEVKKIEFATPATSENSNAGQLFLLDGDYEGSESGTEEEQSAFMKELENFFRERTMEFKPPKFYGEGLNCLKLWRAVTRLGGYDKVTSCKLWRQVGESFKPPKTCTTVSWTFRGFYEKALLDYERHKISGGELSLPVASHSEPINIDNQASGSGRARRDAAARAMQGWHSQRVLGNGEVTDPIIKDKNSLSLQKREKQLGLLKRKKSSYMEHAVKAARTKTSKSQLDVDVVDVGPPADWVKINVQRTKDCFEVYALVPGLLREEVRVQSDPVGRLVISGEPEHPDNPWGVTPFRKVVSLPARIDPHHTSAVVTLHGQLFVRVPFEQSD